MSSYRNEVFNLCKKIQSIEDVIEIRRVLDSFSIIRTNEATNTTTGSASRTDFCQIAKDINQQFFGYIYADENLEQYRNIIPGFNPEGFNVDERAVIERAHATIESMIEICLSDLRNDSPTLHYFCNPYRTKRRIKKTDAKPFLQEKDYEGLKNAFINTNVYKKIMEIPCEKILENIPESIAMGSIQRIRDDFNRSNQEEIKDKYLALLLWSKSQYINSNEITLAIFVLITAIREMLTVGAQLIFDALTGENLLVCDENCIISMGNVIHNRMITRTEVLINSFIFRSNDDLIGDTVLIEYKQEDEIKKEFGVIKGMTLSINREFGNTTKLVVNLLDEELNEISNFTNEIIKAKFAI